MSRLTTSLRQSTFLRHNAIFFAGSIAVGVLNYVYYPVIGRLLDPVAFGEVQALVSLFLQLTIFLSVFGLVTVNVVAQYEDKAKAQRVTYELEKAALFVSLAALAVIGFGSDFLRQVFQFESSWPFVVLALALVASVPLAFRTAYLRGLKKFGETSRANLIGAGGKLAFAVVFVLLGFQTMGAIGGLVAAQLAALAYASYRARQAGLQKQGPYWRWPNLPSIAGELKYALLVLVCSLGIMLLFSVDVLVVKALFDPYAAGLYAGIATVARIVFFLTGSVAQVLLPSVTVRQTPKENYAVLIKSLVLTLLIALPVLTLSIAWPSQLVGLLMGETYLPLVPLLPPLATAMLLLSLANLLMLYHIALRRWAVAVIVIIGVVVTFGLMMVNNSSPHAVVNNVLYGSLVLLITISAWTLWQFVAEKRRAVY